MNHIDWERVSAAFPYALAALVVVAVLTLSVVLVLHRRPAAKSGEVRRYDGALVVVAALIATGVSAQGMWNVAGDALHLEGPLRFGLFAFAEIALLAEANRARRCYAKNDSVGYHGVAVWGIAACSGIVSALDADNRVGALVRFGAPLLAAYLWHSGLVSDDKQAGDNALSRITSRLSPRRVLVWLRLADVGDKTVADVAMTRQVVKLTRVARRFHAIPESTDKREVKRRERWGRKLDRQVEIANAKLGLATAPAVMDAVRAHLGTIYTAREGTSPQAVADAAAWRLPTAETSPLGDRPLTPAETAILADLSARFGDLSAPAYPPETPQRRGDLSARDDAETSPRESKPLRNTSPSRTPVKVSVATVEELARTLRREHGPKPIGEPKASEILKRVYGSCGRDRAIKAKDLHNANLSAGDHGTSSTGASA